MKIGKWRLKQSEILKELAATQQKTDIFPPVIIDSPIVKSVIYMKYIVKNLNKTMNNLIFEKKKNILCKELHIW